jgi:lysozyme family protein
MNFVDEKSLLEAAEAAFQESWKTINLRDGWTSAKVKVRTRARNDMPRYKTLYPGKKLWTQVKISYSCTKL